MPSLHALRALGRIEARAFRRHPLRSLLVVVLIAVPVAAMIGGSTLIFSARQGVEEQRLEVMGGAALRLDADRSTIAERRAALPPHARSEPLVAGQTLVRIPGRRRRALSYAMRPSALQPDGLGLGLLVMQRGQAPSSPAEVALSDTLLRGLGAELGDEVQLPQGSARITGEVAAPELLAMPIVLEVFEEARAPAAYTLLVDLPSAEAQELARSWPADQGRTRLREDTGSVDALESLMIFLLGSFGFFEAALVVAAAFAVSLRRRQREIGLLGSTGATRGGMLAALLGSAAVLACLGGALGLLLGAGIARLMHPHLDGWLGRMVGEFQISWVHVPAAIGLGILTAVMAAAIPGRTAVRLPIRVALGGRRPVTTSSRLWLISSVLLGLAGLALVFVGSTWMTNYSGLWILIGSVLVALGLGCASPWILERLATLAKPLPLTWRLAVRDAGRFRGRNGPVVTAVMAGMSISVLMAALMASVENLRGVFEPSLRDDCLLLEGPAAEEIAGALLAEYPAALATPLRAVHRDGQLVRVRFPKAEIDGEITSAQAWIACGGPEMLSALDASQAQSDLAAGSLVSLLAGAPGPAAELLVGASVEPLTWQVAPHAPGQRIRSPKLLIAESRLAELGLTSGPPPGSSLLPYLVRMPQPLDEAVVERAQALAAERPGNSIDAERLRLQPMASFFDVLLVICIATGLVVIFVATTLSSVESAADAHVLHTVGAPPRTLRGHHAARAGYLALLGCVLAVPAGLMPMYGMQRLAQVSLDFVMPWNEIAVTVFVMPLVAYAGTWLVVRLRQALASRRTSAAPIPSETIPSLS